MPMRCPLLIPTALLAVSGLMLAGCGNNPYPAGESGKNVLYLSYLETPKSLDPSVYYGGETYFTDLMFPAFFRYDYLKQTPFTFDLSLGAAQPKRAPYTFTDTAGKTVQGEQYTFTLKSGLVFQDAPCFLTGDALQKAKAAYAVGSESLPKAPGRAITAADVVYSFKRMADPATQCPIASFLSDKIVGWDDYSNDFKKLHAANYDREMPGVFVDKQDPLTFHVLLNQPYPQLKYIMAMHFVTPQAREAVEFYGKDEYARHPLGCGPFQMTEFKAKEHLTLDKNPHYMPLTYPTEGGPGDAESGLLADAGQSLPRCDRIVINFIREPFTEWNLFQQGYLDTSGVGRLNYQQAVTPSGTLTEDMKRQGIRLRKANAVDINYLLFNMSDATFGGYDEKHRKLRQAISLSINAQEYLDIIRQGNGLAAEWMLPPAIFGYEGDYKNPYRYGTGDYNKNLEKAKQLLTEAGYPGGADSSGQKLVLNFDCYAPDTERQQTVGILCRMIERIGIKTAVRSGTLAALSNRVLKREYQFTTYLWGADYPDAENFLFLLYGPNASPGPNASVYDSPVYNRLFEQARAMEDSPERAVLIRKLRDVSVEDCPWIPLFHSANLSLSHGWLKNVKAHPISADYLMYRRVDGEERERLQRQWNAPNYIPLYALIILLVGGSVPAFRVVQNRINRRVRRPMN